MAGFAYRAIAADGRAVRGTVAAETRGDAITRVRALGIAPLEVSEVALTASNDNKVRLKINGKARRSLTKTIGEIAVLLIAGLQLDRALSLALENIENPGVRAEFAAMLQDVKEGKPLSQAMARNPAMFPAMARAMAEAGEANGQLGTSLDRLATAMKQADELRTIIGNAMIYPIILTGIAVSVILMMLLWVVPQFDSLFVASGDKLPPESRFVLSASRALRDWGWYLLATLIGFGLLGRAWFRQPATRALIDRTVLRLPQIGTLVRYIDTSRFARTLGALIDGGVTIPVAIGVAHRTISNRVIADAVGKVAGAVKEGGGLTRPLAASGVLPPLAIGFFRTGEEISQLGMMLDRLGDVLDGDVKTRLQRLIGLLTPLITVILGATVAAIIAAIMTAILGFNDAAVI